MEINLLGCPVINLKVNKNNSLFLFHLETTKLYLKFLI